MDNGKRRFGEHRPGVGGVALNSSTSVSPSETTIYTITATGPGGSSNAQVTVEVRPLVQTRIRYEYDAVGRIKKVIREQLP